MTHQRKDIVVFNNKEFVLFDTEDNKLIFDCFKTLDIPVNKYMLGPIDVNSALHRGHNERYEIRENVLWGQMIKQNLVIDKPNKKWYEKTLYSDLVPIPFTGACVIGNGSYADDWLVGYIHGNEAYELHFTSGILDECFNLKEAIDFYNEYHQSDFYKNSNDDYGIPIAFHYLKYKYHPTHSMYWRDPENSLSQSSEESKEKQRKKFEEDYQELLLKL